MTRSDIPGVRDGFIPAAGGTEVFAQHIAVAVARATTARPEDRLVIVAGPAMLGVLRQPLPEPHLHQRLMAAVAELRKT